MEPFGIKVSLFHVVFFLDALDLIHIGESNSGNPTYACKFSKLIQYWRQTWNQRTNGTTDIQFPFGFVQVSFISIDQHSSLIYFQLSTSSNVSTVVGGFPTIRWQQTFNVGYVPNSVVPILSMAVALDLRDDTNRSVHI